MEKQEEEEQEKEEQEEEEEEEEEGEGHPLSEGGGEEVAARHVTTSAQIMCPHNTPVR